MIGWLLVASAWATPTVAVTASVDGGQLSSATVQSVVWHSMAHHQGHQPLILGDLDDARQQMRERAIPTLYRFHVKWRMEAVLLDGGVLTARRPTVSMWEYRLEDGQLAEVGHWNHTGDTAIFSLPDGEVSLPEVALQEAVDATVAKVRPPVWTLPEARTTVPVIVLADEEYRARYGEGWQRVADARVRRASAILAQAGLTAQVIGHGEWTSPQEVTDLPGLLGTLSNQTAAGALRVHFTGQVTGTWDGHIEDVGHAYLPGSELVVSDVAQPPGHPASWDLADEGITVAHELLHALGVPHNPQPAFLMSEVKSSTVHVVADRSRQLAQAAARARFHQRDPVVAMGMLERAADAWLRDPQLHRDFVNENLSAGPGVPRDDTLRRGSSLSHRAIGDRDVRTGISRPCSVDDLWGDCTAPLR